MRALVLSGGGAKGAYQAGALNYILGEKKRRYDLYAGVSVGAINSLALAQYKTGSEEQAALLLDALWHNIRTDKVYKGRPLGWASVVFEPSIYITSPLRELLAKNFDPEKLAKSDKKLRMVAVDLITAEKRVWTEKSANLIEGAMASSAFPLAFEPISSPAGSYCTDGGVRDATPLGEAIRAGATEVDVILCEADKLPPWKKEAKALAIGPRVLSILAAEVFEDDIKIALLYNRLVALGQGSGKRHVTINILRPAKSLIDDGLDFSTDKARAMMKIGYEDAKKAPWL